MSEEIEKELSRINSRIDEMISKLKEKEEKVCCEAMPRARQDEIQYKTYETVKRMKFDNDMKRREDRIQEIKKQIDNLEIEKAHILRECEDIERKYYQEF